MTDISKEAVQSALYLLEGGNKNESHEHLQSLISAQASRIEELEAAMRVVTMDALAAYGQAQDALEHLATARNDALKEAAGVARKLMIEYAAEKGSTKTPQGRTAIFYGRKVSDAIIALMTKEPNT